MYLFLFFALALVLLLFVLNGRQSASVQRSRPSRKRIAPNGNSDLSSTSTDPFLFTQGPLDPFPEATHENAPVDNYATPSVVDSVHFVDCSGVSAGGELGSALADSIDAGQSSFGTFDSGSNFDSGTPSDGN
jgi:hypothetical protein